MIPFADHIAALTSHRDRELLDLALASSLMDMVQPCMVSIHRCVGEADDRHWLNRARLRSGDTAATSDRLWSDLDTLPRLESGEARFTALTEKRVVEVAGPPHRTYFPLFGGNDVAAVIEIETDAWLEESSQRIVEGVLRIYRNFDRLLDYSERDTLTGLLNRKTFDESFLKAITDLQVAPDDGEAGRRANGSGACGYWIGVLDIDHFKRVNDRFGHLIGDEVLLLLSRLMARSFRLHDRLYRFGGEEFLVLMRCHTEADAAQALERFRSNTEQFEFPQVGRVTVSIGFTAVRAGDTPSSAFERADQAVYHAKQHGRNQVCSHADLVSQGHLTDTTKVGDIEFF
ncbi:MAG: GGDEF domain-containing protein [Burkholderiaceae bacterium]|nr:GGDEF domain-containing protein [Burkholderiaceae bacterium]